MVNAIVSSQTPLAELILSGFGSLSTLSRHDCSQLRDSFHALDLQGGVLSAIPSRILLAPPQFIYLHPDP